LKQSRRLEGVSRRTAQDFSSAVRSAHDGLAAAWQTEIVVGLEIQDHERRVDDGRMHAGLQKHHERSP
jgi:hypothetical protein